MQVILDSSFARPGSAPIWGGKKVEFRDWTSDSSVFNRKVCVHAILVRSNIFKKSRILFVFD